MRGSIAVVWYILHVIPKGVLVEYQYTDTKAILERHDPTTPSRPKKPIETQFLINTPGKTATQMYEKAEQNIVHGNE